MFGRKGNESGHVLVEDNRKNIHFKLPLNSFISSVLTATCCVLSVAPVLMCIMCKKRPNWTVFDEFMRLNDMHGLRSA